MPKIDVNVIEHCRCPFYAELKVVDCACGVSHLTRNSDVVHYKGHHWDCLCALKDCADDLKEAKDEIDNTPLRVRDI